MIILFNNFKIQIVRNNEFTKRYFKFNMLLLLTKLKNGIGEI